MKNTNNLNYSVLKKLIPYLKYEKNKLIILIILTIFKTLLSIITPYFLAYLLDSIISLDKIKFLIYLAILGIFYLLSVILSRITSISMLKISENILNQIRIDLFASIQNKSISKISNYSKGDILARFTSDIPSIGESLGEVLLEIISNFLTIIGSTILMFHMNVKLSLIVIATVPLFFIGSLLVALKSCKYYKKYQDKIGELTGFFEEKMTGLSIIKSYNVTDECIKEFDIKNKELQEYQKKSNYLSNLILPLNVLISNLGNILILLYGSYLVIHGNITVGVIFAFLSYADMFRSPIHELGSILSNFSSSIACLNRVFELLDYDNIFDGNEILTNIDLITFDKVYFKYDKDYVLKNVSFNISGGEHIAIVGQTGSGKTTIINLLMGIYNTTKGNIYINNKTIDEYKKTSIYENISVILQKPFLFEGTILENVLYGNKNKTKKDAIKALKIVGADFVFKLANKENEYIGVNGKKLSVGERQLIVIARTMLKDAKVLIIDEATSNVDLLTEKKVYEAMEKLMKDKTVIMIAHRLRTIENADKIIYLENGIIKETGTHKDLLAKKSKYYSLYKSQFL